MLSMSSAYQQDGAVLVLIVGQERLPLIEIKSGSKVHTVAFSGNGEHLVNGGYDGVEVWRMEDGQQVARLGAGTVQCLSVSKDGRWIAAGTGRGHGFVWDAKTFQQISADKDYVIKALDFSPDSTRLVTASSYRSTVVWNISSGVQLLGPLKHECPWVNSVKYSPQDDRIATATPYSIRVYNSNNGRLCVDIPVKITRLCNYSLLWSNDQLFVVSDGKIKRVETSTGSTIAEWRVSDTNNPSCIALSQHGEFIAHSADCTVTFWDTFTHTELGLIQHNEAIRAIALSPDNQFIAIAGDVKINVYRLSSCKARPAMALWEDALNDANEAIKLDPSSPLGYERKYTALRGAGHHKDMLDAFDTMLSKMAQSSDPDIRECSYQYAKTKEAVRKAIRNAIRESPRVLINTASGRLCDKSEQAAAFELLPVFTELISSITTSINHTRIEREVAYYYRYATFSQKWEDDEPQFENVTNIAVYELEESPTHDNLQRFCKIVRDAGLHWAWSDTCCIDKADHPVLQEALVSMFKWYEGSAVTIILLRGVRSPSQRGDLVRSVWSTRAWAFQAYHASKVVRFYDEDWTPYRNLNIPNHKESLKIIAEIGEATGVSTDALVALRPGLDNIREKLALASRWETTLVEDAAYSLFGIFSVSLPVIYGEGDKALGRLLAQLLTSSADISILAWAGKSGGFNSCLPSRIVVFQDLPTPHAQPAIEDDQLGVVVPELRASSLNIVFVMKLYDRLSELPPLWFSGQQMQLPCIAFQLGPAAASQTGSEVVFHAQTAALGTVEIKTDEDLSHFDSLYLVHPWIDFLLDRRRGEARETKPEEDTGDRASLLHELLSFSGPSNPTAAPKTRAARLVARLSRIGGRSGATSIDDPGASRPAVTTSQTERQMRALRLVARLKSPFDALLLAPDGGGHADAYRRVGAARRIRVQVGNVTVPVLKQLVDSVRVMHVV